MSNEIDSVDSVLPAGSVVEAKEKPLSFFKKILIFGIPVFWLMSVIIAVIWPALVMFSTISLFALCLEALFGAIYLLRRADFDHAAGVLFIFVLIAGTLLTMYNCHSLTDGLIRSLRHVCIAAPPFIWKCLVHYFRHAFFG